MALVCKSRYGLKTSSKRTTFTSVMFTSSTFLDKAKPNRVRTGAEVTIAHRGADKWSYTATKNGKITDVKKDMIVIEYDDGERKSIPIGRSFGIWSGNIIPHDTITDMKIGQVFSKDDVITYNKNYFAPDPFNKNRVIFKRGMIGNVVLWEGNDTLEDACSLSRQFADTLTTGDTSKRVVKVAFDNTFELLTKEGDTVDSETILCKLRPPMSGLGDHYGEQAREALDLLRTDAPTAKHNGVIDRIDILYSGDVDNMTATLRDLVIQADAKLYRKNKQLDIPIKSTYVDPSYRIDNVDIGEDQVVFIFYITNKLGASVGD